MGQAQRTISSAAVAGRSRLEQLPLIGELGERHHALGDRVPRRLVARHRQNDDEEAELVVGELVTLDIGLNQLGDEVVAGIVGPLGRHLHAVHHQFGRGGEPVVGGELRILVADQLIGPVEELLALFLRHAHQAGDGLQREFAGHLFDEVAGALGRRPCPRCRVRARRDRRAAVRWRAA